MVDGPYAKDLSAWPLVVWRMHRILSVSEFQAYVRDVESVLMRRQRFAQVVIARLEGGGSALTPDTRRLQAQWVKQHFAALEAHCVGMAVVVNDMSPVVHFTISVLMSVLGRTPSPSKIMTNESEALDWARSQLARAPRTA